MIAHAGGSVRLRLCVSCVTAAAGFFEAASSLLLAAVTWCLYRAFVQLAYALHRPCYTARERFVANGLMMCTSLHCNAGAAGCKVFWWYCNGGDNLGCLAACRVQVMHPLVMACTVLSYAEAVSQLAGSQF
jgi:hypothetical protein